MASQKHKFHMEMTCEGCAKAARKVLTKIDVQDSDIDIDLESKTILVTSSKPKEELLATLQKTGKTITYEGEMDDCFSTFYQRTTVD